MRMGFTGTTKGMTREQERRFNAILRSKSISDFHHGDCVGADADAHGLVRAWDARTTIHLHPPTDDKDRAWCRPDVSYEPKPFLKRNHDIVDACDLLVACTRGYKEVRRGSGTWATIRYARKIGVDVRVIYPDGLMGQ